MKVYAVFRHGRRALSDWHVYKLFKDKKEADAFVASQESMPSVAPKDTKFAGSTLGAVVATMDVTKPLYIGMTANYAKRQEFGFVGQDSLGRNYDQAGNYFVTGAIAQWQQIVKDAVKDVQETSIPTSK